MFTTFSYQHLSRTYLFSYSIGTGNAMLSVVQLPRLSRLSPPATVARVYSFSVSHSSASVWRTYELIVFTLIFPNVSIRHLALLWKMWSHCAHSATQLFYCCCCCCSILRHCEKHELTHCDDGGQICSHCVSGIL